MLAGETVVELPVTVPMLDIDRVGVGVPEMDQERVDDCPWLIDEGEAENKEMEGGVAAATVTVVFEVAVPWELVAISV